MTALALDRRQGESLLAPGLLLALAPAACAGGEESRASPPALQAAAEPAAGAERPGLLWEVPPTPWPFAVEVGGGLVEEDVVRGYLDQPWADFCSERGYLNATGERLARAELEFCADVPALFEDLVRGVLFLREAERRYPVLDPDALAAFRERMRAEAGAAAVALERRLGPEGFRAHMERQFRLRKLEQEMGAAQPPVTEEEVMAAYQEGLASLDSAAQAGAPSYSEAAPLVRERLEGDRRAAAADAWVDAHRGGVRVRVRQPDGTLVEF